MSNDKSNDKKPHTKEIPVPNRTRDKRYDSYDTPGFDHIDVNSEYGYKVSNTAAPPPRPKKDKEEPKEE